MTARTILPDKPDAGPSSATAEAAETEYRSKLIHRNLDGSYSIDGFPQHYPTLTAAKLAIDSGR